jgi:ribosome-binding factor A
MAKEFGRPQRLADYLRKEISQIIQKEMRDPRIGMVGVTDVEVSKDLLHARVYVTVFGKDSHEQMQEPLKVLNNAAGFLRSRIAQDATLRATPSLRFYFDESIVRGSHLSSLIDEAIQTDKARHTENSEPESGESATEQ